MVKGDGFVYKLEKVEISSGFDLEAGDCMSAA